MGSGLNHPTYQYISTLKENKDEQFYDQTPSKVSQESVSKSVNQFPGSKQQGATYSNQEPFEQYSNE